MHPTITAELKRRNAAYIDISKESAKEDSTVIWALRWACISVGGGVVFLGILVSSSTWLPLLLASWEIIASVVGFVLSAVCLWFFISSAVASGVKEALHHNRSWLSRESEEDD